MILADATYSWFLFTIFRPQYRGEGTQKEEGKFAAMHEKALHLGMVFLLAITTASFVSLDTSDSIAEARSEQEDQQHCLS